MKNYFYSNDIANKIKELLDAKLPADIKNISVGGFDILPAPDRLNEFLPAVIISSEESEITDANKAMDIMLQEYVYTIYYLYPYTFSEFEDTPSKSRQGAEKVANALINYRTLDDLVIDPTEHEAGGQIITSAISSIKFDNAETKFFRTLEIPASIAIIEYLVAFRTFKS